MKWEKYLDTEDANGFEPIKKPEWKRERDARPPAKKLKPRSFVKTVKGADDEQARCR